MRMTDGFLFHPCQFRCIVAAGIRQSSAVDVAAPLYAAQVCHLLIGGKEIIDGIMLWTVIAIHLFGRTGGEGQDKLFAPKLVARAAVREPVREGLFHPAVQQRGCAVPEQRILQHKDVCTEQAFLFCSHINMEIRIQFV